MNRIRCSLVLLSAIAAHAGPADVPSLFGHQSLAHVLEARRILAAAGEPRRAAGAPALHIGVPRTLPPSGLVTATVSWPALADGATATAGDALTLHCAGEPTADVGDFLLLTEAHIAAGRASITLARAGCAYEIRYLRGAAALLGGAPAAAAAVAAASAPFSLGADKDASGTRVAFGDAASDLQLSWYSGNGTARAYARVATVAGGPYGAPVFAPAPPVTYRTTDMCHAPANTASIVAWLDPGYLHTVLLHLNASTTYFAVYGQEGGDEAPETSFRTRAAAGPDVPTCFVAFGDSATYPVFPGTVTTFDLIDALDAEGATPIDFVAVVGDLAYAEGSVLVWALWEGFTWPVASRIPFQVGVGNHESNVDPAVGCNSSNAVALQSMWAGPVASTAPYGDDCGGEGAVATYARYRAPGSPGSQGVLWYSFDAGSVHFLMFSSEHDFTPGSRQHDFLVADLSKVDRARTPWVVAGMHRPMYDSAGDWDTEAGEIGALEALFVASAVDLVISGHEHYWLRTTSVRNYTVDATGAAPVYLTAGTGGATYHNETVRPAGKAWTASLRHEWGFSVVEAVNRTAMRVTFRANADGGRVRDEAWILRPERA